MKQQFMVIAATLLASTAVAQTPQPTPPKINCADWQKQPGNHWHADHTLIGGTKFDNITIDPGGMNLMGHDLWLTVQTQCPPRP